MAKTYLETIGAYGNGGWQDPDSGIEYFNDRVTTEYGQLGKLKVDFERDFPVIIQADEVVLIRRGFPRAWDIPITGASVEWNPFGFQVFELVGKNGMVRYRLIDDQLEWKNPPKDDFAFNPEAIARFQIGLLAYARWTPVLKTPARTYNKVTTTLIQEST